MIYIQDNTLGNLIRKINKVLIIKKKLKIEDSNLINIRDYNFMLQKIKNLIE